MNIACKSTQTAERIKRFLRLQIVLEPLNNNKKKHNEFFIIIRCKCFLLFIDQEPTTWPVNMTAYK